MPTNKVAPEDPKPPQKKQRKNKSNKGYDPYECPPDIDLAENHGKANMVKKQFELSLDPKKNMEYYQRIVPSCKLDPEAESFSLCCDLNELNFLGSGYILMFSMLKWMIGVIGAFATILTIKVIVNIKGDACTEELTKEYTVPCIKDYLTIHSVANFGAKTDAIVALGTLLFFFIVVLIFTLLSSYIKHQSAKLDALNDVPDDFTIKVEGLPEDEKLDDIHERFEYIARDTGCQVPQGGVQEFVQKTVLAYEMADFSKKTNALNVARKRLIVQLGRELRGKGLTHEDEYDEKEFTDTYQKLKMEFDNKKIELNLEESRLIEQDDANCAKGIAFITFKTKDIQQQVLKYWSSTKSLCDRLLLRRTRTSYSFIRDGYSKKKDITVTQAPDPSEIVWENLGIDSLVLIRRRAITFSATIVLLLICFLATFSLKTIQRQLKTDTNATSTSIMVTRFLSILISIVVSIVNFALSYAMKYFTALEKHNTQTSLNRSLFIKIVLSQFVNSCLVVVAVHIALVEPNRAIWAKGGVLADAWFILINEITIIPFMTFFSVGHLSKFMKRRALKKDGKNASMTQEEANAVFEGLPLDPAIIYSKFIKIFYVCLFYAPILPISGIIGTIALFLNYWIYKHKLLRSSIRPNSISHHITVTATNLCKYSAFVMTISQILFTFIISGNGLNVFTGVLLFLSIVFIFAPVSTYLEQLLTCMFFDEKSYERNLYQDYEELRHKFLTEYDRSNPVVRRSALKSYMRFIQKRMKSLSKEEQALWANQQMMQGYNNSYYAVYDYGYGSGNNYEYVYQDPNAVYFNNTGYGQEMNYNMYADPSLMYGNGAMQDPTYMYADPSLMYGNGAMQDPTYMYADPSLMLPGSSGFNTVTPVLIPPPQWQLPVAGPPPQTLYGVNYSSIQLSKPGGVY